MDQENSNSGEKLLPEGHKNTTMAVLSYIGPLVIISYLTSKDDQYVKFHIKQGLVLLTIEIAAWILSMVIYGLWPIINIINLITFVLSVVGIVYVIQGKEKELPLIGKYSSYFNNI